MRVDADGVGGVRTYGANGNSNTLLGYLKDNPNNGYISVQKYTGETKAGMYVDDSSKGIVWGDRKSFRMSNPNQVGTEICYTCIEGPEAAAYVRGTGHLVNGRAVVTFPEHFRAVASPQGMTVQVTPLSAKSKGLAVVEKSPDGLVVQELNDGTGTYDFDYLVMAVRRGYEDYEVIRPTLAGQPAPVLEAEDEAAP
jgi:hypothetical protein